MRHINRASAIRYICDEDKPHWSPWLYNEGLQPTAWEHQLNLIAKRGEVIATADDESALVFLNLLLNPPDIRILDFPMNMIDGSMFNHVVTEWLSAWVFLRFDAISRSVYQVLDTSEIRCIVLIFIRDNGHPILRPWLEAIHSIDAGAVSAEEAKLRAEASTEIERTLLLDPDLLCYSGEIELLKRKFDFYSSR